MSGDIMNHSAITNKIYSILRNEPQNQFSESLNNYSLYHSEKITPDLLEMVWDRAMDGMLLTDSDGICVAVNASFCSMVNMQEKELIGLPFTVFLDSSVNRKQVFDEYRECARTGNFPKKYEKNLLLSSGQSIFVEIMTSTMVDEAQEMFVLTEFRDIGERKQWEQSTHQSEQRYRSLFENSVLPIYESNVDGKFTNANVALLKLLGYDTFDELLSLNLETDVYVNPDQRLKLFEELDRNGLHKPFELILKRKDGSRIIVLAHSRVLRNEQDEVVGFEGALENITERKEMEHQILLQVKNLETAREELTKLNAQKDKILAIVSHDLRSPFSSILGFCDLLKNEYHTLSDKEKIEYIGFINDAAVQQLNMVNSLLDWSRVETGRIRLKFQQLNVGTIASEIMTSLLGLAKKKNIELCMTVPQTTIVNADEQLLRQLLTNLVGNALKFTPSNGTITIGLKEDSDEQLVLHVSDTGIGIPEKDLKKLFKVEEKYTRQGLQGEVGTGLGLPMCYEIMKKHHGSIEAVSEEGHGTAFILTFQRHIKSGCKKVLIVDDQKGNRMILSRFMKRISEDSETLFAETGKEALEMMDSETPDLIITDFHMPTMDGLELIRRIRNDERWKSIPVILISGADVEYYGDTDALTKILRKPVAYNELNEVMDKIKF